MRLIDSIQIMLRFARETGNRTNLIIEFGFDKSGFNDLNDKRLTLLNSLFYMSIIDGVSFIDEYEQIFGVKTEQEFQKRAIIVKTINKPLISKIKEWKNLKDLRNELLAHNLRKKKNGIYIFGVDELDYNAPRNVNDLFLLSNLIQFSAETIYSEFLNEFKKVKDQSIKVRQPNNILSKQDVSSITIELLRIANEKKKMYNRTYEFSAKSIIW